MDGEGIIFLIFAYGIEILCLGVVVVVFVVEWKTGDRRSIKTGVALFAGLLLICFIARKLGMSDRAIGVVVVVIAALGYEVYEYRKKYLEEKELRKFYEDEYFRIKEEFSDYKTQKIIEKLENRQA